MDPDRSSTPPPPAPRIPGPGALAELIVRAQQGDRAAQDALFRDYYPAVLGMVKARMGRFLRNREESDDVAQSVFRQVLGSEAFLRGSFEDSARFRHWLQRIVENKVNDHLRAFGAAKRGAAATVELGASAVSETSAERDLAAPCEPGGTPSEHAIRNEEVERLAALLPQLPSPLHADVLRLHFLEGLGTPQIAARLKLDDRSIRRLRAEAVAALASLWGGDGPSTLGARN